MLEKINVMRGHKCFQNFQWGQMQPFGKFNLVYGWNGSGKTTLSKLFQHLERAEPITEGLVQFTIAGTTVRGDALGQQPLPTVRVFNRDYVEGSVLRRAHSLEHIFFLGEKAVEKEKERETVATELERTAETWRRLSGKHASALQDYDKFIRENASAIRLRLRGPGKNRFANYDKGNFEAQCIRALTGELKLEELDEPTRDAFQKARQADSRSKISPVGTHPKLDSALATRVKLALSSTPTITAIEALKADSVLSSWLGTGLGLHTERQAASCLFCEQPLPASRLDRLQAHFSDSYRQFSQEVVALRTEVKGLKSSVSAIAPVDVGLVYPQLAEQMDTANAAVIASKSQLLSNLGEIDEVLRQKQEQALEAIAPPSVLTQLGAVDGSLVEALAKVKAVIDEHNRITDNFNDVVAMAGDRLELDAIAKAFPEFKSRKQAIATKNGELKAETEKREALQLRRDQLERELTETVEPAKQLNEDLADYLGHTELTVTHHGKGYAITRSGQAASDLSEGERTGIALLYFLKSLQDHRKPLNDTIVVVDDPVSSLDSGALYAAFGYLKQRTEGAKQLFILTHDFSLFQLVKGWFKYAKGSKEHYQLKVKIDGGVKSSVLMPLDPLLKNFDTEYQYLFSLVHAASAADEQSLERFYGMPNVARRLFEHFLSFRFPGAKSAEQLHERMKGLNLDVATSSVINRFLNINSHGDGVAPAEHDLHLLAEAPRVMKAVMEVMRKEDPNHVARMEALILTEPRPSPPPGAA